jgi:predicted O-methyltransferase YrrM
MDAERLVTYIHSLDQEDSPLVREIAREAAATSVPIVRKETGELLKTLVALKAPRAILEVGTAIGYSAILMAEGMPRDCHLTTIEKYEKRIPIAKRNFEKAGLTDRITLLEGDATEILKSLAGPYDMIFMDAAKGQYIHFFEDALRLLSDGGVLISDNILQDGDILESRYGVERRNRTIHSRMREYLYTIKHHEQLTTAIVPIGDGVAISVKK